MYKKVQEYEQIQGKMAILKDKRSLSIIQNARRYGIDIFENHEFASKLLDIALNDDFNKETFDEFLDVFDICEDAIKRAQMSS